MVCKQDDYSGIRPLCFGDYVEDPREEERKRIRSREDLVNVIEKLEREIVFTDRELIANKKEFKELGELGDDDLSTLDTKRYMYLAHRIPECNNRIDELSKEIEELTLNVTVAQALNILTSKRYSLTGSERVIVTEPDINVDGVAVRFHHYKLLYRLGLGELREFKEKNKNFLFLDEGCEKYRVKCNPEVSEYLESCSLSKLQRIKSERGNESSETLAYLIGLKENYPLAYSEWVNKDYDA